MKPEHVLGFAEAKIQDLLNSEEQLKNKYAECAVAYESKLIPRIFGLKYKNSWAGDVSYIADNWGFWHINAELDLYTRIKYKALYCFKMKYNDMTIDFRCDQFYKYCAENNIPF